MESLIRDYVLVDGQDITPYVESWTVRHEPDSYFRSFRVLLRGWHDVEPGQRWDIVVEVDGGAVPIIRAGIVPPDWHERSVLITRSAPSIVEVEGYDWAWMAQRVRPQATIVLARDDAHARRLVEATSHVVGRYLVLRCLSLSQAVTCLFAMCGVRCQIAMSNYAFAGLVVPPAMSPWEAAVDLLRPFAPRVYVRRQRNEVVIVHRADEFAGIGATVAVDPQAVRSMRFALPRRRIVRRVLVELGTPGGQWP